MSLITNGSYLKAYLADPLAWADYGGYERVVISINNDCPCIDWDMGSFSDSDIVEVMEGYRLDSHGERMGCFVASMTNWLMKHQVAQVKVELPASACPLLEQWAEKIGARCSFPSPNIEE